MNAKIITIACLLFALGIATGRMTAFNNTDLVLETLIAQEVAEPGFMIERVRAASRLCEGGTAEYEATLEYKELKKDYFRQKELFIQVAETLEYPLLDSKIEHLEEFYE